MKVGTFVMGGLAGAALVMMMQRNRTMSGIADGVGQMLKQQMNDVKENAIQRGIDLKFSGILGSSSGSKQTNRNSGSSKNNHSASSRSETEGLDQVEHMASRDPHVKHQINEILDENGQHHI